MREKKEEMTTECGEEEENLRRIVKGARWEGGGEKERSKD